MERRRILWFTATFVVSLVGGLLGSALAGGVGYWYWRDRDGDMARQVLRVAGVVAAFHLLSLLLGAGAYLWMQQTAPDLGVPSQEGLDSLEDTGLTVQELTCDAAQDELRMTIENTGSETLELQGVTVRLSREGNVRTKPNRDWSGKAFTEPGGRDTVMILFIIDPSQTYDVSVTVPVSGGRQRFSAGTCTS